MHFFAHSFATCSQYKCLCPSLGACHQAKLRGLREQSGLGALSMSVARVKISQVER